MFDARLNVTRYRNTTEGDIALDDIIFMEGCK